MAKGKKPQIARTIAELAKSLDLSSRMTATYLAAGMREACQVAGGFDIEKAKAWRAEEVRKRETADPDQLKSAKMKAQTRVAEADAAAKELKNDLLRGDLCYKRDAIQEQAEAFVRVKTRLEEIPEECSTLFPGEQRDYITARLAEKINQVLLELASIAEEDTDGQRNVQSPDPTSDPAADPKRRPKRKR
jgi:hypothetical protein